MKKIVIIGPESTGKSTLSRRLADHYHTSWCPEFAREYLYSHGTNYTYDDLLAIAKGQVALEEEYIRKVNGQWAMGDDSSGQLPTTNIPPSYPILFLDTNLYVMKVWCEFVYGKCHEYIIEQIAERKYDLYLLCNIDLPWVKDELREYPDLESRAILYNIYKEILVGQSVPWVSIQGNYQQRLESAIAAIDQLSNN